MGQFTGLRITVVKGLSDLLAIWDHK